MEIIEVFVFFRRQQHQRLFSGSPYFALMLIYYTHYTIYYTEYITRTLLHEYHCFSLMSHSKNILYYHVFYLVFLFLLCMEHYFIYFFLCVTFGEKSTLMILRRTVSLAPNRRE